MKLKVSIPMMKAIKQALPKCIVSLEKFTIEQYQRFVDIDVFNHENDYDAGKGVFKLIRIAYPPEYYAMPNYITTNDLYRIYKDCDGTYDGFIESVKSYCDI